jgi:hypothetical protein
MMTRACLRTPTRTPDGLHKEPPATRAHINTQRDWSACTYLQRCHCWLTAAHSALSVRGCACLWRRFERPLWRVQQRRAALAQHEHTTCMVATCMNTATVANTPLCCTCMRTLGHCMRCQACGHGAQALSRTVQNTCFDVVGCGASASALYTRTAARLRLLQRAW